MPNPVTGITAGVGLLGAAGNASAVRGASREQSRSAAAGIAEQRRQFDAVQELLAPYVEGGEGALYQMLGLSGAAGSERMQDSIQGIQDSPEMAALVQQGENAILQNASATGGLRGGNTQGALAQFRPQVLSQLINDRYNRLGGIASMGQASAAGVGAAGQAMAGNVGNLLAQQGSALAGGRIGQAAAFNQGLGVLGSAATDFVNSDMGKKVIGGLF